MFKFKHIFSREAVAGEYIINYIDNIFRNQTICVKVYKLYNLYNNSQITKAHNTQNKEYYIINYIKSFIAQQQYSFIKKSEQ